MGICVSAIQDATFYTDGRSTLFCTGICTVYWGGKGKKGHFFFFFFFSGKWKEAAVPRELHLPSFLVYSTVVPLLLWIRARLAYVTNLSKISILTKILIIWYLKNE